MTASIFLHDGSPATEPQLGRVAFAGFAHFTSMQVRNRSVRGLDLHLARLRTASDTLFDTHLDDLRLSRHLQKAVAAGPPDASVTVFIASRPGEFEAAATLPELETFVRVSAPAEPPAGPLSLDVVQHVRDLPQVKHVGEVGKTLHLRRARARGFDDALFVDADRHVSEATIWNLAFWDGSRIVWPRAAMLDGVTQQILRRQLTLAGVPQVSQRVAVDRIDSRWSAALMSSWSPGIAVSQIGGTSLDEATTLLSLLREAFEAEAVTTLVPPSPA